MRKTIQLQLIAFAIMSALGCSQPPEPAPRAESAVERPRVSPENLASKIDPFCRMSIDAPVAEVYTHQGKQYGFCSDYCRIEFAKDPEKYLANLDAPKK